MRIAFIGAGNVATVLAKLVRNAGHVITGVYSATIGSAQMLAEEIGAPHFGNTGSITGNADIYIIAVNDIAIAELGKSLKLNGKIVVHTSGSTPQGVLSNISEYFGVLYPLQSLRKEAKHQPIIPLLINGSNAMVKAQLMALAGSISPSVQQLDDGQRLKLHLAAVMVSNFTNFLYTLAQDYCQKQQVSFYALVPLITEVAQRTELYNPAEMQTGPAVRGDYATIDKHLKLLDGYPVQQQVYAELTSNILRFYHTP